MAISLSIPDVFRAQNNLLVIQAREKELAISSNELQKVKQAVNKKKEYLKIATISPVIVTPIAIAFIATVTLTTPILVVSIVVGVIALGTIGGICVRLYKKIKKHNDYAPERNTIHRIIADLDANKKKFLSAQFEENVKILNEVVLKCKKFSNKEQLNAQITTLQAKIQREVIELNNLNQKGSYRILFDSLGVFPAPDQNAEFYHEILDRSQSSGSAVADELAKYLVDHYPYKISSELCLRIVCQGHLAAEILAPHFITIMGSNNDASVDFASVSLKRLEFCKQIISHSSVGAGAVATHCVHIPSTLISREHRLELYSKLAENSDLCGIFIRKMSKCDFLGTPLHQRLDFFKNLIELQKGSTRCLSEMAAKIGEFDLSEASIDQRLQFYKKIIRNNSLAAEHIAKHIINSNEVNLTGASAEQRLQFYGLLIEAGVFSAEMIALSINQLNLTNFTSEQRFRLFTKILEQKGALTAPDLIAPEALLKNVDKLILDKEHRIALYKHFAKIQFQELSPSKKIKILWDFKKFDLHDFTNEERLNLYILMVREGLSKKLADNFENITLTSFEWCKLCKEFLKDDCAIRTLILHFGNVCMQDKELFEFIHCIISRHLADRFIKTDQSINFLLSLKIPDTSKKQILIDLLSSLSGQSGGYDLSGFAFFTNDIQLPLAILNKKADQVISKQEITALKQFIYANPQKLKILGYVLENREREIPATTDDGVQQRGDLMRWAAYAAVTLNGLTPQQVAYFNQLIGETDQERTVLEWISCYQDHRYHLLRASCLTLKNSNRLSTINRKNYETCLLAPLGEFGLNSPNALESLFDNSIELITVDQNKKIFNALANCLIKVSSKSPYSAEESHDILSKISSLIFTILQNNQNRSPTFSKDDLVDRVTVIAPELIKQLTALASLFQLSKNYGMRGLMHAQGPSAFFLQLLREDYGVELEHISSGEESYLTTEECYQITFGQFDNSRALHSLAENIKELSTQTAKKAEERAKRAKEMLSYFVTAVFKNEFEELRYNPENNPRLRQLIDSHPTVMLQWRQSIKQSLFLIDEVEQKEKQELRVHQFNDLEIIESDKPEHLLMLQGTVKVNVFAFHLMDGTKRVIVVKEKTKVLGGAFIHIACHEKKGPVLKLQTVYTTCDVQNKDYIEEAIQKMAEEKARILGIELLTN